MGKLMDKLGLLALGLNTELTGFCTSERAIPTSEGKRERVKRDRHTDVQKELCRPVPSIYVCLSPPD